MSQDPPRITLRNALLEWCREARVEDVQEFEVYFLSQELATFGWPNLGSADNRGEPAPLTHISWDDARYHLDNAWKALLLDFREKVERGQVHLRGVQMKPERHLADSPIPGLWAADFNFDVLAGTVEAGEYRWVRVTVAPGPPDDIATVTEGGLITSTTHRVDQVAELDDDVILELLEEYARRVIARTDIMMMPPGKISLMPIIRGKMRHRAERHELLTTLKEESEWLAYWVSAKVELHQTPTAATIKKVLGSEYRQLLARSKAAIQPRED